jgi:ribosomal protein S12 methylthiotransferase accessory factor
MKSWRDGGRRACPPAETWARLKPLLPVFGISRVGAITGLDRIGVPVFTACRPNARSLSVYQGKGLTADAARVSAVMEAYETWCAESVDLPLKFASIDELRYTHRLVDLDRLPLADPDGPDPGQPFLWIEGNDLMGGGQRWLPFEIVHANYAHPEPPRSGAWPATTNGLASGNTADEAVLHALMEVIERDAVTLWRLRPDAWGDATALRPETVDDSAARGLLDRLEAAGIEVAVWDATSDTGTPCFLALIHDPSGTGAAEIGAGAHPSPAIALIRALTEAVQVRGTFIAGAREDIPDEDYTPAAIATRRETATGILRSLRPRRDFGAILDIETDTFADDIERALDGLRAVGVTQTVCVAIGKPALPFPVVRVVVPGLEAAFEGAETGWVPGPRAASILKAAQ